MIVLSNKHDSAGWVIRYIKNITETLRISYRLTLKQEADVQQVYS